MTLSNAQKVRLGAFVVLTSVLALAGLLLLGGLQLWTHRPTYRVRFHESVGGLERSTPVKYQGLRVGRVEAMGVAADDPTAIEVAFSLDAGQALYAGTQATLDAAGITGLQTVNLIPGRERGARLEAGALLPEGPSLYTRLTGQADGIVGDVRRVAAQLVRLTSDENRQRLEGLLTGLDAFIGHLNALLPDASAPLGTALADFSRLVALLDGASSEVNKTLVSGRGTLERAGEALVHTLNAYERPIRQVDPNDVARAVTALRSSLVRLDRLLGTEDAGRALSGLGDTLGRVNRLVEDVDVAVRAGRQDFTASLSYLRQAAEDLREFSRLLAQNPSILVRGRGEAAE